MDAALMACKDMEIFQSQSFLEAPIFRTRNRTQPQAVLVLEQCGSSTSTIFIEYEHDRWPKHSTNVDIIQMVINHVA